ncbi:MAG: CehA/McbA family metallohydrolase [Planctomycetota bacterium]|jgi:hypothetical protein
MSSINLGIKKDWQPINNNGTTEWWRETRHMQKRPLFSGDVCVTPKIVKACSRERINIVFKILEEEIKEFGHIAIELPLGDISYRETPLSGPPTKHPFISVKCSRDDISFEASFSARVLDIMFKGGSLKKNDVVTIIIGHEDGNAAIMSDRTHVLKMFMAIDADGSGIYRQNVQMPEFPVIGNKAESLRMTVPSVIKGPKIDKIKINSADRSGNVDESYEGKICVLPNSKSDFTGQQIEMRSEDKGNISVKDFDCPDSRSGFFNIIDAENGLAGKSNPYLCLPEGIQGNNIYFGDIHYHNFNCDGFGSIDEGYLYALEREHLDFAALTNHVEGAKRYEVKDFWDLNKKAAEKFYAPGEFVTFLGYEWGGWSGYGDKCVYFSGIDEDFYAANSPESDTPEKLWNKLRDRSAITIPHHPKYGGWTDWDFHDNDLQPLVEIYSNWGFSETGGSRSVQGALQKGHKLGFIAGSDGHASNPGCKGLTAVLAPELTRESLFDAMKKRRTYATTGARIIVDFQVNQNLMGNILNSSDLGNKINTQWQVVGTSTIEKVEIIKNNEVLYCEATGSTESKADYCDEAGIEKECYYYLRVTQENGEMAWSSPVWITDAE